MKQIFIPFKEIISSAFDIFTDKVNHGDHYEIHLCSVFMNTKSSGGQPDHCNYPRSHD